MTEFRFDVLTRNLAVLYGPAFLALNADSDWENWALENLLADRPEKWQLSWLAWHDRTPIGYVVASRRECAVHVHRLVVGALWRGLKIGRRLVWNVASAGKRHGASNLTLKVHERNRRAIDFYESCGFRSVEPRTGEYVSMSGILDDILRS